MQDNAKLLFLCSFIALLTLTDVSAINVLSDDSDQKTIMFYQNESQTVFLKIPKNANVTNASLSVAGIIFDTSMYADFENTSTSWLARVSNVVGECYQDNESHSGNYSLKCIAGHYVLYSGSDWKYVDVLPNTNYTISWWYKGSTCYYHVIQPMLCDDAGCSGSPIMPEVWFGSAWQNRTTSITTNTNTKRIAFIYKIGGYQGCSGWVWFDSISFWTLQNASFPTSPNLGVGNDSNIQWKFNGIFNGSETITNISSEINEYLSNCTPNSEGNCLIPLTFHSDSIGKLNVSGINVQYTCLAIPSCSKNTDCNNTASCTVNTCNYPGACNAFCSSSPQTNCINNDSCCPSGCSYYSDNDCQITQNETLNGTSGQSAVASSINGNGPATTSGGASNSNISNRENNQTVSGHEPQSEISNANETKITIIITPGIRANITSEKNKISIKEIQIDTNSPNNEIKVTITKLVGTPKNITKNVTGTAYEYIKINLDKNDTELDRATVEFEVRKNWINENRITPTTIKLNRYVGNTWSKLPTTFVGEDLEFLYFEAHVPGFSYFAITGDETPELTQVCIPNSIMCVENSIEKCNEKGTKSLILKSCDNGCNNQTLSCKANYVTVATYLISALIVIVGFVFLKRDIERRKT